MTSPCVVNIEKKRIIQCSGPFEANRLALIILAMTDDVVCIYNDLSEIDKTFRNNASIYNSDYFES